MPDKLVVLITGTSRGVGRHLAEHYLAAGARVVGCSRGEKDLISHDNYLHLRADVGDEKSVAALFGEIRRQYGRLDVAINSAAINPTLSLALMTSFSAAEAALRINFLGTFLVSREAAKLMMRNKFGRIINLSSMAVRHEVPGEAIYTASKAAVNAFTRVFAKEVSSSGITCNVLAPAALPTDLMAAVDQKALLEILSRNAIPKIGNLEDVTAVTDWLIMRKTQSITGQIIYLGGA